MLGRVRTLDTSQTDPRFITPKQVFYPRTSWPEGPDSVPPVVIPGLAPLWTSHSKVTGPYAQSEPCATIWVGPQTDQEVCLGLLQERFSTRYLLCHYLLMD